MTREEESAERRGRVLDRLLRALPEIAEPVIATALATAKADAGTSLRRLDDHLDKYPSAFTSGDSRCPIVIVRLAHELLAAGCSRVRLPGCSECQRTDVELPRNGPQGRVCQACAARVIKGTCARCGRSSRIAARREGGGICYSCYKSDPDVVEECSRCGRVRNPAARLEGGRSICGPCTRPIHVCAGCGEERPAAYVSEGRRYCGNCYAREFQPRRPCSRCGMERRINKRATADSAELCEACNRPKELCVSCGRVRFCWRSGPGGAWLCRTCRPLPKRICSRCGRSRHVDARWPRGLVCSSCYRIVLDHPSSCGSCKRVRPLVALDADGALICGPCGGFDDLAYECIKCGRAGELFAAKACARCVLVERLHNLLAGPDGEVSEQLQPLIVAFALKERARGMIFWINRSPNAALLAELAATGREITHELLDGLPFSRNVHYVRDVLVYASVLPERDEDIERIPHWLDHVLVNRSQQHVRLVRPFVHWSLLRKARQRAIRRRYPAESGRVVRARTRVALEFLEWIEANGLDLRNISQDHIDRWLAAGGTRSHLVRYFLKWACDRGVAPELCVPNIPRGDPVYILDEDVRWSQLDRCVNDEQLPLDIRCVGGLILLFGLPVSRIRFLRPAQVCQQGDETYLEIGRHPLILPPKFARLLQQLIQSSTGPRARIEPPAARQWIFPGLVPGRPASASSLGNKLSEHGIEALPARHAALVALLSDVPPSILADILGLHISTVERWAALAKRGWADYVAARAED